MATFGGETGPNKSLTRGSCLGCHGQDINTGSRIVDFGGSKIPQVLHSDSKDLAGGNFRYILQDADNRGHNVNELGNNDDVLLVPPGQIHDHGIRNTSFSCAGDNGCHGYRNSIYDSFGSLKGAHHDNVDGQLLTADTIANSYRFLYGVKGYENDTSEADRWQNASSTSHNEYFGASMPTDATAADCGACHSSIWVNNSTVTVTRPSSQTISGFCSTCHGNFHMIAGIGGDYVSPFIRHPSDIKINTKGLNSEYAGYTTYNENVPVGRLTVPASADSLVDPADASVTCLSCHTAHASNYPDMLRWDYTTMIAETNDPQYKDTGCFICHTTKDSD